MEQTFNHISFQDDFSEFITDNLDEIKKSPNYIEEKHSLNLRPYINKTNFPRIDSYFMVCGFFKKCPAFTLIDFICKYIPAEIIIKYLQKKIKTN